MQDARQAGPLLQTLLLSCTTPLLWQREDWHWTKQETALGLSRVEVWPDFLCTI